MQITLSFQDSESRSILYYLRKRYHSKAGLGKLAKMAIRIESANEAINELKNPIMKVSNS